MLLNKDFTQLELEATEFYGFTKSKEVLILSKPHNGIGYWTLGNWVKWEDEEPKFVSTSGWEITNVVGWMELPSVEEY